MGTEIIEWREVPRREDLGPWAMKMKLTGLDMDGTDASWYNPPSEKKFKENTSRKYTEAELNYAIALRHLTYMKPIAKWLNRDYTHLRRAISRRLTGQAQAASVQ